MNHNPSGAARQELALGWPTVLTAALAISVGTMGIGFYSLGLFVTPLQDEYGWSRAAVASAATFSSSASSSRHRSSDAWPTASACARSRSQATSPCPWR